MPLINSNQKRKPWDEFTRMKCLNLSRRSRSCTRTCKWAIKTCRKYVLHLCNSILLCIQIRNSGIIEEIQVMRLRRDAVILSRNSDRSSILQFLEKMSNQQRNQSFHRTVKWYSKFKAKQQIMTIFKNFETMATQHKNWWNPRTTNQMK